MVKRVVLSSGEKLIVGLAGNLFNGDMCVKLTPLDLVGRLDRDTWEMVLTAFSIRRGTLPLNVRDIADD